MSTQLTADIITFPCGHHKVIPNLDPDPSKTPAKPTWTFRSKTPGPSDFCLDHITEISPEQVCIYLNPDAGQETWDMIEDTLVDPVKQWLAMHPAPKPAKPSSAVSYMPKTWCPLNIHTCIPDSGKPDLRPKGMQRDNVDAVCSLPSHRKYGIGAVIMAWPDTLQKAFTEAPTSLSRKHSVLMESNKRVTQEAAAKPVSAATPEEKLMDVFIR